MTDFHRIIAALRQTQPRIVGVDGDLGAGKTKVAGQITALLDCTCLHLDAFLLRGQGTFAPSIHYDQLQLAIAESGGTILIEGVCLLAVLDQLSIVPDYLIFVDAGPRFNATTKSPILTAEVGSYLDQYSPRSKANAIISLERLIMTSSNEADIAYIRSKTIISIVLAVGGLVQTISGALLLNAGLNDHGTATLKIMGDEFSSTGLGGIVLCTSVMCAFLAYRARPKYRSISESRHTTKADGSSESYEYVSKTQAAVETKKRDS
jgi:hypothetical protein